MESFKNQRLVWIFWIIFCSSGLLWMLFHAKGDAILYLNKYHTPFSIELFHVFTRFGEWFGISIVFIYLLFTKPLKSIIGYAALLGISILVVFFFKQIVFPESIRPFIFFKELNIQLPNEPTYFVNRKFSFPSGHTTGAFAYFCYAAFWANKSYMKLLLVFIACLGGLSRIFLVQHFVEDVVAGSFLGISIAYAFYVLVTRLEVLNTGFLNKRLLPS